MVIRPESNAWRVLGMSSSPVAVSAILNANELPPVSLSPAEFDDLIAFLHALTDPASLDLRKDVPFEVPSGLPVTE